MSIPATLAKPAVLSASPTFDFRIDDLSEASLVAECVVEAILARDLPEGRFPDWGFDIVQARTETVHHGLTQTPFLAAVFTSADGRRLLEIGEGRALICCFGRFEVPGYPRNMRVARFLDERVQRLPDLLGHLSGRA